MAHSILISGFMEEIRRNDPCPCGSKKKYKHCCLLKKNTPKKIKATWISQPKTQEQYPPRQAPDLVERTFGDAITQANKCQIPP